jgi:hypothetical protein
MAAVDRVVDIAVDAVAVRRRRHALLRLGIPILGVAFVIAAIFVIALYSDAANRRGALALSDDLLDMLDAQSPNGSRPFSTLRSAPCAS